MSSYTSQRAGTPTPCGVSSTTGMLVATSTTTTTTNISVSTTTTPPGEPLARTLFKLPASSRSSTASSRTTTPPPTTHSRPEIPITRRPSSPLISARYSPLVLSSAQIERSLTDPFSDRPLSRSGSIFIEDGSSSPSGICSNSASQNLVTSQRTSSFVELLKASGTPGIKEARSVRSAKRAISKGLEMEAEKHRDAVVSRQQSGQYTSRRLSVYMTDKTGDTTEDESEVELVIPVKKPLTRAGSATSISGSGSGAAARPRYTPPSYAPQSPSVVFEREAEAERIAESEARREAILGVLRAAAPRRQVEAARPGLRTFRPLTGEDANGRHEDAVQSEPLRTSSAPTKKPFTKDNESGNESDCSRTSTKRKAACLTLSSHDADNTRSPRRRKPSPPASPAPTSASASASASQPSKDHPIFTASKRLHSLTSPSSIPLPASSASLDCHHDHTTCPLLHRLGLLASDNVNIRSPNPRTSLPHLTHCPVHLSTTNAAAVCHLRRHDRRWLHKQAHIWASLQNRLDSVAAGGCKDEWSAVKIRECSEGFMQVLQEAWRGLWMCEVGGGSGMVEVDADDGDKENVGGGRVMKRLGAFGRVRRMGGGGVVGGGSGPLRLLAQGEVVVRPIENGREREEECDLSRVEMGADRGGGQDVTEMCEEQTVDQVEEKTRDSVEEKSKGKDKNKDKKKKKKKGRRLTPLMDEYDVKSPNYTNEEFRRSWNSIR